MTRLRWGADVGHWVAQRVDGFYWEEQSAAIGLERDGRLVAGVIYEQWNGKSAVVHLAIEGRPSAEWLYAIADYPFRYQQAYKLIAPIASTNTRMLRLAEKIGFRTEAELRNAHPLGDIVLMTLVEPDCRLLKGRYGKNKTAAIA